MELVSTCGQHRPSGMNGLFPYCIFQSINQTSTLHQKGFKSTKSSNFSLNKANLFSSTTTQVRLPKPVLTLNFAFDSSHFLLVKGVAMGIRMVPAMLIFLLVAVNTPYYKCNQAPVPTLKIALELPPHPCRTHQLYDKYLYPLKFTWIISNPSLPFLDLCPTSHRIHRGHVDVNCKPTDSYSYRNYPASHPASCKNAVPYSQFLISITFTHKMELSSPGHLRCPDFPHFCR